MVASFYILVLFFGLLAETSRTPHACHLLVAPSGCDLAKRKADATNILFSLTLISARFSAATPFCTTSIFTAVNFHSWSQLAGEVAKIDSQPFYA